MSVARSIAMAQRMIAKNGGNVTWIKTSAKTIENISDATKPWKVTTKVTNNVPDVPQQYVVKGVFKRYNNFAQQLASLMKGTDQTTSTQQLLLPGNLPFTPEMTDTIIAPDGTSYSIEGINPVQPSGVPVLWQITLAA